MKLKFYKTISLLLTVIFTVATAACSAPEFALRPRAALDREALKAASREVQIGYLILRDSDTKVKVCMQPIGQNVYFTLYTEEGDGVGYIKLQKDMPFSRLHLAKVRIHPEFAERGLSYVLFDAFFEALCQGILVPENSFKSDLMLSGNAVHPFVVKTIMRYGFVKSTHPDEYAITVAMGPESPNKPTPIFVYGGEPKRNAFMEIVNDQYDSAADFDVVIFEQPSHPGEGIFKIVNQPGERWENIDVNTSYSLSLNQNSIAQIPRLSGCDIRYSDFVSEEKITDVKARRLVRLANDWKNYKANENEIMRLACELLGIKDMSQFRSVRPVKPVILAAGKGKRFREQTAADKNLVEVDGIPSLIRVLDTIFSLRACGVQVEKPVIIVSPENKGDVEEILTGRYDVDIVVQEGARGTGDAVFQARGLLEGYDGDVLVTFASQPVVTRQSLLKSIIIHQALKDAAMTVPSTVKHKLADSQGRGLYAPLIRDADGMVVDGWQSHLEKRPVPELGEDDIGVYIVKGGELFPTIDLARYLLINPHTGRYTNPGVWHPLHGNRYHAPGEFGFPNEVTRTLTQRRGKLVVGLAMADPREQFGLKNAGDIEIVARFIRELSTASGPLSGVAAAAPLIPRLQDAFGAAKHAYDVLRETAYAESESAGSRVATVITWATPRLCLRPKAALDRAEVGIGIV